MKSPIYDRKLFAFLALQAAGQFLFMSVIQESERRCDFFQRKKHLEINYDRALYTQIVTSDYVSLYRRAVYWKLLMIGY